MTVQRPRRVTALPDQRGVFPGVDLEHHRGAVPGLPHDRVRVRAGRKASVTNPARSECPPSSAIWAGVNPACSARRRIISFTACPVIAPVADRAGLVHRREQRPLRVGRFREPGGAAHVQHRLLLVRLLLPSPTGRVDGGLPAEHPHHRPPAAAVGGGVAGVQHLPPPDVRAGRAGHRVPPVRQRLHLRRGPPGRSSTGPQPHVQAVGRGAG